MTVKDFITLICDEDQRISVCDGDDGVEQDGFWLSDYRKNPGNHPIVNREIDGISILFSYIEIFVK